MKHYCSTWIALCAGIQLALSQTPSGTVDPAYAQPVADGMIASLLSDVDGRAVFSGSFTNVNGTTSKGMARVNSDGSLDSHFHPALIENESSLPVLVRSAALMNDGRIYIEGDFTRVGDRSRTMLARLLPDGNLDESFVPALTNSFQWLALQPDGEILSGMPVVRLRLDGTVDPTWTSYAGIPSRFPPIEVRGTVQPDGKVLLALHHDSHAYMYEPSGLYFRRLNADGSPDSSYQGQSSLPIGPSAGYTISPLLEEDGAMPYFTPGVAGWFDGMPLSRFQTNGQSDSLFRKGLDPLRLTFNLIDGTPHSSLALQDGGRILVSGSFSQVDGQPRNKIARLLSDGSLDPTFVSQASWTGAPTVLDTQPTGDVLAAGQVSAASPVSWKLIRLTGDRRDLVPRIVHQPTSTTVNDGDPAGLLAATVGYPMPRFQWQRDGTNLPGATNAWLTWSRVGLDQTGVYTLTASNRVGQVQSQPAQLTVLALSLPTIVAQPADRTVQEGGIVAFSVTATNLLDLFYQWRCNGTNIVNATNATLSLTNVLQTQAGPYSVVVSNRAGAVVSSSAYLTVNAAERAPGLLDPTFFASTVPDVPAYWRPVPFGGTSVAMEQAGRIYLNVDVLAVRLHSDGTVDTTFKNLPGMAGGPIYHGPDGSFADLTSLDGISVQPDGKLLIRGVFSQAGGQEHNQIARLNADGSVDQAFQSDPGSVSYASGLPMVGLVRVVRPLSDGKIVIAGEIVQVNGTRCLGVARLLPDGTVDPGFGPDGPQPPYAIRAVAELAGGKLLLAEENLAGPSRVYQLNPDGTLDTAFQPLRLRSSSEWVNAIVPQPDGKALLGGTFTNVSGTPAPHLARLNTDGTFDSSFVPGSGANNAVTDLLVQPDGKILVIGDFTSYQGVPRKYIARLNHDGSLDQSFNPGPGPDGQIQSMALQPDGQILIGGSFTNVDGTLRRRVARLFGGERPGPPVIQSQPLSGPVFAGQQVELKVLASGLGPLSYRWQFNGTDIAGGTNAMLQLNGVQASQAGRYTFLVSNANGSTAGQPIDISITAPVPPTIVQQPVSQSNSIGQTAIFSVTARSPLPLSFQWRHDGIDIPVGTNTVLRINGVTASDAGTYAVLVRHVVGATLSEPALLLVDAGLRTGLPDLSFDPAGLLKLGNGYATVDPQGRVLVAGSFEDSQGNIAASLVRLNEDGSLDSTFHPLESTWGRMVTAVRILPDSHILFAQPLIRLDSNGNIDPAFTPPAFSFVFQSMNLSAQADGRILVGGGFFSVNDQRRDTVVRLTPTGQLDPAFRPFPAPVENLFPSLVLVQPDQRILVWHCWLASDNNYHSEIVRFNPDGMRDPSFTLGRALSPYYQVQALALQSDGKILLAVRDGGDVLRLTAAGTYDETFHPTFASQPPASPQLFALLVQADDKILVAGDFTAVNGIERHSVARLNADGTLDTTFDPGAGADSTVSDLALTPDGDIIAVGAFTSFNGVPRPGIVRLHGGAKNPLGPRLTGPARIGNVFRFQIETEAGRVYLPETKDSAGPWDWKPMPSATGTGQRHEFADPEATNSGRIYRIRVLSD